MYFIFGVYAEFIEYILKHSNQKLATLIRKIRKLSGAMVLFGFGHNVRSRKRGQKHEDMISMPNVTGTGPGMWTR